MASAPPASVVRLDIPPAVAPVERGFLRLGGTAPGGRSLQVNSRYLELDGRPWLPVMGEFHYSRYPQDEWEAELHKLRAGGVDIVASYVFWSHHEAQEGRYDWSGRRDLRRFAELAQRAGLYFHLRPGPWVHAEARHGGFPDWLAAQPPLRCNDLRYLARVARFYGAIGKQLRDLMWRDGGPVIGVQLENEYDGTGPGRGAEHIAELRRLAIAAGLEVPLYTVTGWPTLDIPARDVLPVSGAYPDGFWGGDTGPQPASGVFLFNTGRAIGEMGNVGGTPPAGRIDPQHYPFFLAEAGGGMHVSSHRRPVLSADDVAATALVQLGSGANLYGYYMFHGGTNPARGLHETQATGYPNDVPELGYDFRAPLGAYGQPRPSYGRLRALHAFLAAFGPELAPLEAVLGQPQAAGPADRSALRVAARGAGGSGFVFVNNHVRHHPMPALQGVQLQVQGAGERIDLPARPMDVPPGAYFIWPFGQRFGAAVLRHATLQPLTRLADGAGWTWVLFSLPGLPVELCFERAGVQAIELPPGWGRSDSAHHVLLQPVGAAAGDEAPQVLRLTDSAGHVHRLVLLSRAQADQCACLPLHGRSRLVMCPHGVHADGNHLLVSAPAGAVAEVQVFPAADLGGPQDALQDAPADAFMRFAAPAVPADSAPARPVRMETVRPAQPAPPVRLGPHIAWRGRAVPLAPGDADFEAGLHVRLHLDPALPASGGRVLLSIHYLGDAARLHADGALVDDHFYDGEPWLVGVDRFARDGRWPELELRIVAAHPEAPVFLEDAARRRLAEAGHRAAVLDVQANCWRTTRLAVPARTGTAPTTPPPPPHRAADGTTQGDKP